MSERLRGRCGQPHGGAGSDESDVEPEGQAVDHPGAEHVELQWDLDPVQVRLFRRPEVDHVTLGLGHANADVKCVHLKHKHNY